MESSNILLIYSKEESKSYAIVFLWQIVLFSYKNSKRILIFQTKGPQILLCINILPLFRGMNIQTYGRKRMFLSFPAVCSQLIDMV